MSRQVASWAFSPAVGTTERPEDLYPALQGELCNLVQILDFSVHYFICKAGEESCKTSLGSEVCFRQWPAAHGLSAGAYCHSEFSHPSLFIDS